MSRSQDEPPCELEDQFILRLPLEHVSTVRKIARSGSAAMKDKLKIDLLSGGRHAVVGFEGVSLPAKLVDLPCVIESLKTLDKKTFFKTADISQMLVCTADGGVHSHPEELVTSTDHKAIRKSEKERQKKYVWKHGITPPLRNVRKRSFCKATKKVPDFKQIEEVSSPEEEDISARHRVLSDVTGIPSPTLVQHVDSPDVEKQVKRLLCSDTEAVSVRWEVVAEGETEEIESQGFIPGFEIASEMSGYKQRHTSPEYGAFREMVNDSSSNRDEVEDDKEEDEEGEDDYDDEDEDKKEEEDRYEVYMESEPQAKFIESGQYEAKEASSSMVMEIQKQTHYVEKKLQEVQRKGQRQKELIMKVENLMLKNHLQPVLEQLKLQEKQKNEQLISLREKRNCFLKD
ncbi:transcription initiation factor TFIID subunit 7-like [Balaenoptera acutorostrata]|uniref:Transcription initiation factor TFIID subunit 7-like n=1 Tax=Balaenoptera acutorostrata TaxID=9767 RepID=A0A384A2E6_BALAC|nr:transcription initiation factor TFIID subunit 7-like [Balaenoptera acutorostrata]XP_057394330.1 transcription initiation factor TFIID subunit 7-like [Balaenoptera acutorostrata]XP_057394331.1 transcription initiation factor TFIID subunit 7-like [Balaenoptera acutorostrata]